MRKAGVIAFGTIWGVFSMMFGVVVLMILFLEKDAAYSLGKFFGLGVCLYNSIDATGFTTAAYIIGLGGFALVLLGCIGIDVSRRSGIAGGVLMLISVTGVFLLYFLPLTFGSGGLIPNLDKAFEYDMTEIAVIALVSLVATLFGLIAAILAFIPAKPRYAQYGAYAKPYQPYGQPQYGQPYAQPYQQPQYGQPYQQPPYGRPYQPQYQQPPSAPAQIQTNAAPQNRVAEPQTNTEPQRHAED